MVLEYDWAVDAARCREHWSPTLRTTASFCLNSRFPILLMWGPELVMIYNDAYAPLLGDRHPAALGARAAEVWVDIWDDIGSMAAEVFAGRATYSEDLPLVMSRYGYQEETYFTFSFSPVLEPGGQVAGLVDTVVETTKRVLATRRLGVLQRLGSLPRSMHGSTPEAVAAALRVLAEARSDCPFGLVYLASDGRAGRRARRRPRDRGRVPLKREVIPEQVRKAIATGQPSTVTGLDELQPGLASAGASPVGDVDVHTAVVLPLVLAGQDQPIGAVVLGTSPHLPLDDEYRIFLTLAAGQVAAAVADAEAVETARRRAEERAELDRARASSSPTSPSPCSAPSSARRSLPDGFAVHYEPATGTLEVGGDWYDVVDLPGGRYGVVVGDVVGRGLAAAAVMGQLRSAGRALLLESQSPAHVLIGAGPVRRAGAGRRGQHRLLRRDRPARRRRPVQQRRSSARDHRRRGRRHPPARRAGVAAARGRPRASSAPKPMRGLLPGSTLLLYTDGLIERRDEALDEGIARAVEVLSGGRHLAPEELAGRLTERLLVDAPDDDVALLLYRCDS